MDYDCQCDKNMRFYSSANLKQWEYMSEFGEGFGPQPNQFECPDFIQLPVDGDRSKMKWVMIVNINPGFVYGGSGTMYFVGDFDGHRFVCDTKPEVVKWLDWEKIIMPPFASQIQTAVSLLFLG